MLSGEAGVTLPSSGTFSDEGGVESARMRSSRKNATNMFMPAMRQRQCMVWMNQSRPLRLRQREGELTGLRQSEGELFDWAQTVLEFLGVTYQESSWRWSLAGSRRLRV